MIIGILKEIKVAENRVCMTPAGVEVMTQHKHQVLVEKNAGLGSGFSDQDYRQAGAMIIDTAAEIFARAEMVMHVKEPQPQEYPLIREGPDRLHLPAPGRRRGTDQGPDRRRFGQYRLRDHPEKGPEPAASDPDERGRRPDGRPGRGQIPADEHGRAGESCSAGCPGLNRATWW